MSQARLFETDAALAKTAFPTSTAAISQRIAAVRPVDYAKTRNFINGAVTRLSPYISRGVISGHSLLQSVLEKGFAPWQIEKFIQELAWREYFQRVWQHLGEGMLMDIRQPQPLVAHYEIPEAVLNGATGIESIDRAIAELEATGYVHNHLRMYVASIVCNIGRSHWGMPAKWLYYHLLDGDVASNTCSWQWVAGSFASKKYWCNQENINKYTFSRQRGGFLDLPYPELEQSSLPAVLEKTVRFVGETTLPATAQPQIDPQKPLLIYNSYNLDAHWRASEAANRVLLLEPSHFFKYPVSQKVISFILNIAENIPGIQIFTGEMDDLLALAPVALPNIISKEHPAFAHYPGQKDERDWLFPQVKGWFPSFSVYWKTCSRWLKAI